MMFLEGQLQARCVRFLKLNLTFNTNRTEFKKHAKKHERKKMAADLAGRDSLINQIQRKFEAQEKMIELMQRQCEKGNSCVPKVISLDDIFRNAFAQSNDLSTSAATRREAV